MSVQENIMAANIITITREFGSGGRTIGRQVADTLGYTFYDWELVMKIAQESGFDADFVSENCEDSSSRFSWLFKDAGKGMDLSDQLYCAMSRVVEEIASKGKCVLVGRCADYILRERTDVLSCFIFADEEFKKERIVNVYGETEKSIDRRLKEKDGKRKSHYQYYTGRKWGRAFFYDVCLDSGRLGIDNCTSTIVALVKEIGDHQKPRED